MKFVSVVALFTAALVSAETQEDVSYQESQAWHGCTDSLVQEYDQGATGDVPSCNLWDCLHKQASYYDRGGTITAISNLLTPTCLAARLPNPGGWINPKPKPGPPVSYPEYLAWDDCMSELIEAFEKEENPSRAACNAWVCLHNVATTYARGGVLTKLSNLLTPICTAAGVILPIAFCGATQALSVSFPRLSSPQSSIQGFKADPPSPGLIHQDPIAGCSVSVSAIYPDPQRTLNRTVYLSFDLPHSLAKPFPGPSCPCQGLTPPSVVDPFGRHTKLPAAVSCSHRGMAQRPSSASRDDPSKAVVVRQRKTHRKSRLGCANCKLRGVKCDESKPTCSRCTSAGFSCTYSAQAPTLQPSYQNVFSLEPVKLEALPPPKLMMPHSLPSSLPIAGSTGNYVLRQNDRALVSRFVHNTILTFGPGEADGHKSRCMMLANAHKYLYHIYIGFAQLQAAHGNVVPGSPRPSDGATMALHMYHSATMFKETLAELMPRKRTISSLERDALWMGASMLATSCFANIDSLDPREVWPLRAAPDMMDLDWLRMNQGKDIVWAIADLGRPDSVFHDFYVEMGTTPLPSAHSPIRPHALSPLFYTVFDITPSSAVETNVYHGAVSYLSQIIDDDVTIDAGARLFVFPMEVGAGVKKLLRARDPRALLLLVYWHAKLVAYPAWWVKFRCIVEGLAIAMHLRRAHSHDSMPDLIRLLEPPRQALLAQFRKSQLTQVWPQEVVDEAEAPYM